MIASQDDRDLDPPDESSRFVILTSGTTGSPKGAQRRQPESLDPASVALGVWPDIGALMIAAFLIPAALFFHTFWRIADPGQKQTQTQFFWRNTIGLGACAMMFGTFVALGPALRFTITAPLFNF